MHQQNIDQNQPIDDGSAQSTAKKSPHRFFYRIFYKSYETPCGIELLNEQDVFAGSPPIFAPFDLNKRGFRPYPATPRFHLSKKFGHLPSDIEPYGSYWLISERAKEAITQINSSDFAFIDLNIEGDSGNYPTKYWMCDVITATKSVDMHKSSAKIRKNDRGEDFIVQTPYIKLKFKEHMIEGIHIFRIYNSPSIIVCDDIFRNKIMESEISGLIFKKM